MYNDEEALRLVELSRQSKAVEAIQRAWRAHVVHEAEITAAEETAQHAAEVAAAEAELRRLKEQQKEILQLRSSVLHTPLPHSRSTLRLGETSMKVDDGKLQLARSGNASELNTTSAEDGMAADEKKHSSAVNDEVCRAGRLPLMANNGYVNEPSGNAILSGSKALLLEQYRALLAEREASVAENAQYQRMLAKYYNDQRQRKGEDGGSDGEAAHLLLTTPELEKEYWCAVRELGHEKEKLEERRERQEDEFERRRQDVQPIIDHTTQEERNFISYVASLAARATFIHSNNQHLPLEEVKAFLDEEERIREEIRRARINLIVLKNKLSTITQRMMSNKKGKNKKKDNDSILEENDENDAAYVDHANDDKDDNEHTGKKVNSASGNNRSAQKNNADDNNDDENDNSDNDDDDGDDGDGGIDNGMFLIDFEQLKIESNNLHDKIEERNEDLGKLTRKVNTTLHVLSHVKEKLSYIKGENEVVEQDLQATESEVNAMRDQLAQLKKQRDHFNRQNKELRDKMPLIGSQDLLKDYEQRKGEIKRARELVVQLTERHRVLMQEINKRRPQILSLQRELSEYPE